MLALAPVAAVLAQAVVGVPNNAADGLVLMAALMAGGVILARLPPSRRKES